MSLRIVSCVLALLAVDSALVAQKAEDVPHAAPDTHPEAGLVHQWKSAQGQPFWYRIPKKVSKSDPPNLLLMLHGTGTSEGWSFWNYPIASGRFRPDDIVVSPEGVTPGGNGTFNFVQGKEDGEQLASIVETFRRAYPIGRVYVYGHSQGAFFSYWFAGAYPELVDGIVAHAGNVLDVRHSKASREGVAIGILHGKADAVVPVDCAYRTEKIYRAEGYENLKLYVVEGLTERSGHWPLPAQVTEMLEWLDTVTEASPDRALLRAWHVAASDEVPDLASIRAGVDRASELARIAKRAAKPGPEFAERSALLQRFLADASTAHQAALADAADALRARAPEYGAFAAHFRIADRALRGVADWDRVFAAAVRAAKSQERQCQKALVKLREKQDKKSAQRAAKTLEKSFLAPSYDDLSQALARWVSSPAAEAGGAEWVAEVGALLDARGALDRTGKAAAERIAREFASKFREEHPELVPIPVEDD